MAIDNQRGRVRRRCPQCKQMKVFVRRKKATVCSRQCEMARRKAAGVFARMHAKSIVARMATKTDALVGLGLLTDRERAIYIRGKRNGYEAARAGAFARGYRKGWAEALNEQDDDSAPLVALRVAS